MRTILRTSLFSLLLICTINIYAESRKEFIQKYKQVAICEMERTGIPASIKLAQGILESGCGQSNLSTQAHNLFGIKCHDWTGDTYRMTDDAPNECFRKYDTPEQSWIDHSTFLTTRPRYAELFKLPTTDYKAWAKGLKAAGYATNPRYAELLITIIEDEELYKYDKIIKHPTKREAKAEVYAELSAAAALELSPINYRSREEIRNGVLCITTERGDSYAKIAGYYGIKLQKLLAYNDTKDTDLELGQLVFLKSKKNKAARGFEFHRVKPGESLHSISQMYGVKLKNIIKYNYISESTSLLEGEKIFLRDNASIY